MIAVKECGMALRFANRFKCDKEIVLEAIKSNAYAFIFINDCFFINDSIFLYNILSLLCISNEYIVKIQS